jgi:GNAT superfamily N-acetyltransferase
MHLRHAIPADLDRCLELDASFDSERVWQLDLRPGRDAVSAQLRATDLPRQLRVDYPSPQDALLMHWQRGYCIIVAEDPATRQLVGFVDVGPEPDLQLGWIWHLVVDRSQRRQGVGTTLLAAAASWCQDHQLRRMMIPLQIQNEPGIRFCQRHGFTFCGFNDRFYQTGAVALFLCRSLR